MKAFAYIGSNSEISNCEKISNAIKNNLNEVGIETKFFMGRDCDIKLCKGCNNCFRCGTCLMDLNDDMKRIREEMLSSDIIILVSPVYCANVSGMMKNYIDRITSFCHTLNLSGKLGCVVAVSSGNSLEFTTYYMQGILEAMGCNVIHSEKIKIILKNDYEQIAKGIVEKFLNAIKENKQWTSKESLEANFKHLKRNFTEIIPNMRSTNAYEIDYWHNVDKQKIDSFQELLNRKKQHMFLN